MPYGIYIYEHVSNGSASIQSALDILNDSDKQHFSNNVEQWNCGMDNHMFDLIKYSSIDCKLECKVLMDGYAVFRTWMLEIDHDMTIQSLASDFMLKSGYYNNVCQTSGVLQHYITRAAVGGRCMTANNKVYHVKKKITDLDACGLYSSAMYYMDGRLEGLPKVLTNLSYEFLKQEDGYVIRIKLIKLNKHLYVPLTSTFDEDGDRNFTNHRGNEIIYIVKTGVEDLIEFQK